MPPHPAPTGRSFSRSSKSVDPTVPVGEIVGAHGLRGLLRVRAYQPPAPSLHPGAVVLVQDAATEREATVVSAAPHGRGLVLLRLEGVGDRNAAEALVRARILVRTADLPPAGDEEFYYHEVAGFSVETTAGEPVGTIAETFTTGLNDVWVVRDGDREHLIPVIADVVRALDRAAGRVVIEPLPGLLD